MSATGRGITFDTGALIALERRGARMLRILAAVELERITIPTVVLAEWWRGTRKRRMSRLFEAAVFEPLDERLARIAGEAVASVKGATTIDAIVMASAAQRGDTVFTSDIEDLQGLAGYFKTVRVLHA